MPEAKWKRFEVLIAEVQRQLAPGAEVRHNQHVMGQSGRRRQLDVTITQKIGPYSVFIVIECRRFRRPVGIDRVESFSRKLRDVGAALGVMVATSGFDGGAKAIATQDRIMLMTYREAQEADWQRLLGANAWFAVITTDFTRDEIVAVQEDGRTATVPGETLLLVDGLDDDVEGAVPKTIDAVVAELWPALRETAKLGSCEMVLEPARALRLRHDGSEMSVRRILVRGAVKAERRVINLRLGEGDVLEGQDGGIVFQRVASEGFDWAAVIPQAPAQELSQEEYDQLTTKPGTVTMGPIDLTKAKKFLRIVVETRKS